MALKYCKIEQYITEYAVTIHTDENKLMRMVDMNTRLEIKRPLHSTEHIRRRWRAYLSISAALAVAVIGGQIGKRLSSDYIAVTEMVCRTAIGEVRQVSLPDNSTVWLNSNSTLYYPEEFKGKTRQVRLEGEAFFDVSKDAKHPFTVQAMDHGIKVLGTQFDVEAYPDNATLFRTTLVSGRVVVTRKEGLRSHTAALVPGQRYTYNAGTGAASIAYVDTESLTSWRTGRISFSHTSLKDVLAMIGNTFGIRFVVNNAHILDESYTGTFDNLSLDEILSTLEQVTSLRFKQLAVVEDDVYPRYIVY